MGKIEGEIIIAYKNLWTAFHKTSTGIAEKLEPLEFVPQYDYNKENGTLTTKEPGILKIKGWPYDEKKRKKSDIIIEIKQSIKVKNKEHSNIFAFSSVKVTYLEHVRDSQQNRNAHQECNIFGVIRYDFGKNQSGHPIFHAHVGVSPIDEDISKRNYQNRISQIKNLRIPTPPMDLKAVLIGFVADHCPSKLKDLTTSKLWKIAENDLPGMPIDFLKDKIDDTRSIDSLQWYIDGD
jgi:hypothetical protein